MAGPLIGGYLTDHLGWRWVFLVSVPFAVLAIGMLIFYVTEPSVERTVAPIDWSGAVLLTLGMSTLLWVVLDGSRLSWPVDLALLGARSRFSSAFVIREHHAADPILPMDLMTRPVIAASLIGSFLVGGILFGLETYVPLYIQGVRGGNATLGGGRSCRFSSPGRSAWPWPRRRSCTMVSVAAAWSARPWWPWGRSVWWLAQPFRNGRVLCFMVGLAVCGLGFGPTSLSFILAVQHAVNWGQRGVATGAVTFLRTIGGALGVGLLGATLGWELTRRLAVSGASGIDVAAALRPETHKLLSATHLAAVQLNLGLTLKHIYLQMTLLAVGTLVCALWLPELCKPHSCIRQRMSAKSPRTRDSPLRLLSSDSRTGRFALWSLVISETALS